MKPKNKNAAPTGIGNGAVVSKAVTAKNYHNVADNGSIEYAVAKLTRRFHLRMETARVIYCLSGLGGAI